MAEKVVRFTIDAEQWKRFRLLAIQRDRTVAEYLGELVNREVNRRATLERKHHAGDH